MSALPNIEAGRFALLIGLSLFFGFAFEQFYSERQLPVRPGGVRTFPLLALAGGGLYLIEPQFKLAFVAGMLVLGAWTYSYVRNETAEEAAEGVFIIPICNVLAYTIGAVALTQPLWLSILLTVVAVLLLSGRRRLHELADTVPFNEVLTAGQFLILVGVVLPLLYGLPAIPYTKVTPFGVWLAVVAVSSISYASYLLGRYAFPKAGTLLAALLGGLYSSTATTVVLARRAREEGMTAELRGGIVLATAMMYLRILAVSAIFNAQLGRALLLPLGSMAVVALALAFVTSRSMVRTQSKAQAPNPLQLGTAFVFAILLVAISVLTDFVQSHVGSSGVLALSAVVGFTDIDPFVLGLAQGGAAATGLSIAAVAIVIATASNNVLKAAYAAVFSRRRESWVPIVALVALAGTSLVIAFFMPR